ncbi:MAG: DUF11 domain-containing protein, partial [Anaerolineales bacterium]|nr:DUF11 domain-containing protein [Anaerolineales bacterium]
DVDAREIIIRDFLPRGMSYVPGSDSYNNSGNFSNSATCTAAPTAPTTGTLSGLQYVEWSLCSTAQGSVWEVEIEALISDAPDVAPDWLVANFGKLSGQNSDNDGYSLRDSANVDYTAPDLVLTKSASPATDLRGGDLVTYTISVANAGRATAYNLVVTDTVPAHLLIPSSGGSASPVSASYTSTGGDPAAGAGGELTWSSVGSLAVGETISYVYTATVESGLPAGTSMTNLASVRYNSRADNTGHATATSSNPDDNNSDEETVYTRGVTVRKEGTPGFVTIGDTVHWVITATVPGNLIAYWPVIEENNLPDGMDFLPATLSVNGAALDTANHTAGYFDDGNLDLRFYFQTIDNGANAADYQFTIEFDTLVTGVQRNNSNNTVYRNCCRSNADNDAFIGWYGSAAGYNGQGYAYEGSASNRYDFRSPEADADVKIDQPRVTLSKQAQYVYVAAGGVFYYRLNASNNGTVPAYEVVLSDTLPAGITYVTNSTSWHISDSTGTVSHSNSGGSSNLGFSLDQLNPGATAVITYYVQVDAAISAGLWLGNSAEV